MLRINNNLKIKLLGIHKKDDCVNEAIEFLEKKLSNQQIYLRFDEIKYDEEDNLLAYVFMKNKTFINSHLIKKGLAKTDKNLNFKYMKKFLEMEREMVNDAHPSYH